MPTGAIELENIDELSTQEDLKVVFEILPIEQGVPQAMTILQDMVAKSGLELKSTTFGSGGSSKQASGEDNFKFNIAVSGQINLLRDFLMKIQNSPRIFQVESIGVQFQKTEGVVEADIPLSVFYQSASGDMGSMNQPLPKLSDKDKELLKKLSQIISQSNVSMSDLENIPEATTAANFMENNDEEIVPGSIPLGKPDPFE